MSKHAHNSLHYHLLQGLGFLLLIGWFWLMREVAFMDWITALGPASHRGAMNMVAIMLWMLPAFLLWKYYLRWIHRLLNVRGFYYEDHYYQTRDDDNDSVAANANDHSEIDHSEIDRSETDRTNNTEHEKKKDTPLP